MNAEILDKKISYFTAAIMNEVKEKTRQARRQEASELRGWLEAGINMAEKDLRMKVEMHRRDLIRRGNLEAAYATAKAKKAYHDKVAAITDALAADVAEDLLRFTQGQEYEDYLIAKIKEAGQAFAIVLIPPGHMHLAGKIEAATGLAVEAGDEDYIGGFMLLTEARNARLDCTFKTKLKEADYDPPWER